MPSAPPHTSLTCAERTDTLPDLILNGAATSDWEYVRQTENYETNMPVGVPGSHTPPRHRCSRSLQVTDVTSDLIRCYETDTASQTSIATVSAGDTVGFKANGDFYHPGVRASLLHRASTL